ncbi:hypothetical protein SAMD00023353_5200380 [Rosellinia necatrix]|uniref:Uncharacterized protein n=1 Tax=Rosellinia necatrix TaxID=77044 RepID=A0A1S8AAW8_ROSNE|nr:hypothetical protein SAMD00023353_5200380 [Rosellinia necatrix]
MPDLIRARHWTVVAAGTVSRRDPNGHDNPRAMALSRPSHWPRKADAIVQLQKLTRLDG